MKTRHLTEIEKSIVLSHADYAYFLYWDVAHTPSRVGVALDEYLVAVDGESTVRSLDELAMKLDSVTVAVE